MLAASDHGAGQQLQAADERSPHSPHVIGNKQRKRSVNTMDIVSRLILAGVCAGALLAAPIAQAATGEVVYAQTQVGPQPIVPDGGLFPTDNVLLGETTMIGALLIDGAATFDVADREIEFSPADYALRITIAEAETGEILFNNTLTYEQLGVDDFGEPAGRGGAPFFPLDLLLCFESPLTFNAGTQYLIQTGEVTSDVFGVSGDFRWQAADDGDGIGPTTAPSLKSGPVSLTTPGLFPDLIFTLFAPEAPRAVPAGAPLTWLTLVGAMAGAGALAAARRRR
jgi:hypothetical protein